MFKKTICKGLVLIVLVFFGGAAVCFAETPEARLQEAWKYKDMSRYKRAEGLYRAISIDYPGTDYDLTARREVVILDIMLERNGDVQAMLGSIISDFSQHAALPEALYRIAQRYEQKRLYEQAKTMYQQIAQQYPTCKRADGARSHLRTTSVICLIRSGDYAAAQQALEQLKADFSGSSLSGKLCDIAYAYGKAGKNEEAESIYQGVIADYPATDDAFSAQRQLASLYINMKDYTVAKQAVDKLTADFSERSDFARALYFIADSYEGQKRYGEVLSIYATIVDYYSGSEYALLAYKRLVYLYDLWKESESGEKPADPELSAAFSEHSSSPAILYIIAGKCTQQEQIESIYQTIAKNYPGSESAFKAQKELALMYVTSGKYDQADAVLDKMLKDFAGRPCLQAAAARIAEEYYIEAFRMEKEGNTAGAKGNFQKAVGMWQMAIDQLPADATTMPQTCSWAGECYSRLGEYSKSIACYQKVADDYPKSKLAWNALFMVGRNYEKMMESGLISASEANSKTRAAYQKLVREYPTCYAAKAANRWLSRK